MTQVSSDQIKKLRQATGAGISDVKKALEESKADYDKAMAWLERKLGSSALKRAGRETKAGIIDAYLHSDHRIGVMVELFCETDFVARSPLFQELAHDIALQVAAMKPIYSNFESIPKNVWEAEKVRIQDEVKDMNKPSHIMEGIVDGKLKSFFGSVTLWSQTFIKDQDKTVEDVVKEAIGKFGENIQIGNFVRFEI